MNNIFLIIIKVRIKKILLNAFYNKKQTKK
jgi:hypothetical protein